MDQLETLVITVHMISNTRKYIVQKLVIKKSYTQLQSVTRAVEICMFSRCEKDLESTRGRGRGTPRPRGGRGLSPGDGRWSN